MGSFISIHLFIQNLVVSKYLKFSISDYKVWQDYIRQIGVDKTPGYNTVFFIRDFGEI